MLAGVGGLFEGEGWFAFHHKTVKILLQQGRNRLSQGPNDTSFDVVNLIENAQSTVLKDRIRIQY